MVYITSIGPGGSSDYLSVKAYQILQNIEVAIYAGTMIGDAIKKIIPGKLYVQNDFTNESLRDLIKEAHQKGQSIAWMEPGDVSFYSGEPGIFDSLTGNIQWLREENIPFELIPGISSWTVICNQLGIENVLDGVTQTIVVNAPIKSPKANLKELASLGASLVFFMGINTIEAIIKNVSIYYPPQTTIIIADRISWEDQKIIKSTLENIIEVLKTEHVSRQSLILIGKVYETANINE
ncbi:MAG: Cobalamin biosynthesis precorrin-3 methylase CbiF [uncultured Aureispira sp.]|uniref:Cobalamin biosynthesis precorrin-3 methylase CbiF n=1 Tax=uncultured Aureispira sp. TaxID=1331704 RepID=A0A6S6TUC8_9BACT|nr:MAG: Cobalamin biosynthesis precorrin-3 methylase CbiF [uncultured Aureispira sp.]